MLDIPPNFGRRDNCNVKVVIILRTVIICELPNYSITFFEGNKFLLFARDVIYLELIYSCHMIILESVDIWISYPNL